MMRKWKTVSRLFLLNIILLLGILLASCSGFSSGYQPERVYAEVVFEVNLPTQLAEGQSVQLEILDEISCLNFNPTRYEMSLKGENTYYVRLPLPIQSVVKYRFIYGTSPTIIEKDYHGDDIRYRMALISEPMVITDTVISWDGQSSSIEKGSVSGYVVDVDTNAAIPSVLITIAGKQTYTSSNGYFEIKDIPTGENQLVAYHPSGAYDVFQQKAVIAAEAQTPANFGMKATEYVNVTFQVKAPSNTIKGAPVRLIGNTLELGNTFAELNAGCSVLASRAPTMTVNDNSRYSITLSLPVGLDLRYKYSLGDGFWNAERKNDGSLRVRQLTVPDHDVTIDDSISSWLVNDQQPLTIRVKVPETTPKNDQISLQINPFVWMEPLPMWNLGNNEWVLSVYSPLDVLTGASYRYCRNDQCEISSGIIDRSGSSTAIVDQLSSTIQDTISEWQTYSPTTTSHNLKIENIQARPEFIAGVEVSSLADQNWQAYSGWSLIDLAVNNFNWIYYTPSWTYHVETEDIGFDPDFDQFWLDHVANISYAQSSGISTAIFPRIKIDASSYEDLFSANYQDYFWWHSWFRSYQEFVLHFVNLANQSGAQSFILGGEEILPFLQPGSYNLPADIESNLVELMNTVRERYSGQIGIALPFNSDPANLPDWIDVADFVYLLYSPQLSSEDDPQLVDLTVRAAEVMDYEIYEFYRALQKPILLGLNIPSVDGSARGCLSFDINCDMFFELDAKKPLPSSYVVDLKEQEDVYLAMLRAMNQRDWIIGFSARGYFSPLQLNDYSSSIYGKPASQVIQYWMAQ